MVMQARATGGMWFSYGGLSCVSDPGPGSLVQICAASPPLDSRKLCAIFLTHRHLDHSTDINVLAEAMTAGGFDRHGMMILPNDALYGDDPVFLKYMTKKVGECVVPQDGVPIDLGCGVTAEPVAHVHHGVDCFGFIFRKSGLPAWGIISDTKPLDYLSDRYSECSYISLHTTFPDKKPRLDHMSVADAGELLKKLHPKLVTLTHFGMTIIEHGPEALAAGITTEQTRVVAGRDGMIINLDTLDVMVPEEKTEKETFYTLMPR